MTENNQDFLAAKIGSAFKKNLVSFDKLLEQENKPELTAIRKKLREELKTYREQGAISVAFVGQYSAGKSTIISALTGKRDIKIDADIATDKTSNYNWNGIQVLDTPGLFTERQDHDEITYDAINKADLLVFCLTYMLFDSVTVENFKKLAYEKGYRWKMMLVINKMSDEAGEEEQKIANYRHSLAEALKPYSLDEFPVCFIDAKDYCEGVDEKDDFLMEISRFQTFIDSLNEFVNKRAALAKFDTPVRIALSCLEEAQLSFTRNSTNDSAFLEILNRLSRVVRKERSRIQKNVQSIGLKMSSEIAKEGYVLASAVGNEDIEVLNKQVELNVQKHYEKAETDLQSVINAAAEDIRQEVEQVFEGDLVKAFVACLDKNQNVSAKNAKPGMNSEAIKSKINFLNDIGTTAGAEITKLATRGLVKTAMKQGLLRPGDVAGSGLHIAVVGVGKLVGFKFKPWQAVGIAKNLGNAAKFLGPAMAVVSVGADLKTMHDENEHQKKMANIRQDITSQFQTIGKDLEAQISIQLFEFEQQVYGEIEKQISVARRSEEESMAASNTGMKELMNIREKFELILKYITKATEKPVA
ncbi:GTPase [Lyngbya sp. PCC 8106]|uniref:GTPase n=1 Tax=Lyngbya sp. (strain PCC 8106) TaxID=313612 RepID=UPI0000EA9C03|nr:GTPase [Lyngbya sp. PCC 8106]EAW37323.1 Protein containing N-terminal predicted GTPase domain [Lyngbya sp. PCC 8106]